MKKMYLTLIVVILLLTPFIIKKSLASEADILTSSTYEISNNNIYAIPTTYDFKVEELLRNVVSTEKIKIYNSNNEVIGNSDTILNGYKLKTGSVTYNIVVMGDVTGDGNISLGDVSALYNHFKNNKLLSGLKLESGKLTKNSNVTLGDVSKLYNYYRGNKPFTYYSHKDIEAINNYIEQAKQFKTKNPNSNKIGTNIVNELNVSDKAEDDQIVVTKDGKVEAAFKRHDFCYRKSASSDSLEIIEGSLCKANVTNFPSNGGQLHISGSKILDKNNHEVFLHGSNIAGLNSLTTENPTLNAIINLESLHTLRNWGANIVRLFAAANVGYGASFIGNEDAFTVKYKQMIDMAIASDMYIIVNWDGARNDNKSFTDEAVDFFTRIASAYPNNPHIIYEIWNEPEDKNTWTDVHNHADKVIPAIRKYSPDSVVLVGSPGYDINALYTSGHELSYSNIMYTFHSYMNYYRGSNVETLISEIERGVPIIVTEWGSMSIERKTRLVYDELAESFAKILYNHKISNLLFSFGTSQDYDDPYGNKYGIVITGKWENELPDRILKINGKFMKTAISNNYQEFKTNLLRDNANTSGRDYRSSEWKNKITSIEFKTTLSVPSNAVKTWDLSLIQDGSIIGYLLPTSETDRYKMVISANGNINAPQMSNYLFAGLANLKSIDFNGFTTNYTDYMSKMFYYDSNLTSLDLSGLRSDYVKTMNGTFEGCTKLQTVNMSTFVTKPVTSFERAFYNCTSLTSVDMGNMDITSDTAVTDALTNVKDNCSFKVKDNTVKSYLSPTTSSTINFTFKE